MKRFFLIFTLAAILFQPVYSQLKDFTIEQAVLGQFRDFAPKTLLGFQWRPATNYYTYVESDRLVEVNAETLDTNNSLLKLDEINLSLKNSGLREIRSLATLSWIDNGTLAINGANYYAEFSINSKTISKSIVFDEGAVNFDISPNRVSMAYTIANNLVVKQSDGTTIQVTNDLSRAIVNGQSVHRNEFGISKGTFWSPSGEMLAYYRMDESMVTDYPMVDINARIAEVKPIKYPMAGMQSHVVTLGIFNLKTQTTTWIHTGEPAEQYLTNIAWSTNEKCIYIAIVNRDQNRMWLNEYDVATGNFIKTLFEESNERYVEPMEPMVFMKSKPNQFVWQSRCDGFNQLYLYNINGSLIKKLTNERFDVTQFLGFDGKEQFVYYLAATEMALERQLYRVNIQNGKTERLTQQGGYHRAIINFEKGLIADFWSSLQVPNQIDIIRTNGKLLRTLLVAKNPYEGYSMGTMEMVKLTANDGKTQLNGRMILPANFNSNIKYPVIIYVYGGPHNQLVSNSLLGGARLWEYYMGQKGYILFTLDNRGTANRGFEFESEIHRQLGVLEVADQMVGANYLRQLPYVDSNRIGVHGWSYGGFMAISLMLKSDNAFKVGVAGGPVIDWSLYEIMYGERYMDTPEENAEGYRQSNLANYLQDLQGKLLLIHGDIDPVVVPQHSLKFIHECVKQGIQVDFFVYPTHEHNVRGRDRVHLMEKVTQYFDNFLK